MSENKAIPIKGIQVYDHFIDEAYTFNPTTFALEKFAYNVFGYRYGDNSVMIQEFGQEENDKEFSKIVKLFNKIKRRLDEGNAAPIKSSALEVQIEFIHD